MDTYFEHCLERNDDSNEKKQGIINLNNFRNIKLSLCKILKASRVQKTTAFWGNNFITCNP